MRDADGMYPAHPAHDLDAQESTHAKQVADLQAERDAIRTEFENWKHTVALLARQHGEADDEVERLRSALLAWKIECAAFSLHNGESQIERTRAARIESRINGILEGQ